MALRVLGFVTAVSNENGVQDTYLVVPKISADNSWAYGCAGFFSAILG